MKINKKGSIWENLTLLIFFFVLAIGILAIFIGWKSLSSSMEDIIPQMQSVPHFEESYEQYIERSATNYPEYWDPLIVIVFFGIFFIVCILSWLTPNLPIFSIMYWGIGFFLIIAGIFLSIAYTQLLASPSLQPYVDFFPMTAFYFSWAWLIWMFKIMIVGVLLYANGSGGSGVGY